MVGPSGSRRRRGRRGSDSPRRRRNCHQMKNEVEIAKTTIETQAFSRSPAKWCAGSIRMSSSTKRPAV